LLPVVHGLASGVQAASIIMNNRSSLFRRMTRWAGRRLPAQTALIGLIALLALTIAGLGALAPADARAQSEALPIPADIQLHVSDSATLDGGALQVSLIQIDEDSRCPMNVMCVWMGRAVVRLQATVDGVDRGEVTATLYPGSAPPQASDRNAVVDRYVVTVTDVQPYPVAGQTQPLDQRIVTLRVAVFTP
jgi:hypothetical protein